jgi:hypothetical protein
MAESRPAHVTIQGWNSNEFLKALHGRFLPTLDSARYIESRSPKPALSALRDLHLRLIDVHPIIRTLKDPYSGAHIVYSSCSRMR